MQEKNHLLPILNKHPVMANCFFIFENHQPK